MFAWKTKLDALLSDILSFKYDKNLTYPFAAQRVIAQRLGYDLEDVEFVDGAGDRGIDFWSASPEGINIYQVKTHLPKDDGTLDLHKPFDSAGVNSLSQAFNFISTQDGVDSESRLYKLLDIIDRSAQAHKLKETSDPINIGFSLIILGERLTDQAFDDLANYERAVSDGFTFRGTNFACHVELITIDDLLKEAWREDNFDWIDVDGKPRDTILLSPLRQSKKRDYLNDNHSAIFYCRASDLIRAYRELGYQIFEPNVRANIRNSPVNNAIQASASHTRSMKEFRFLNNGLTIICNSYQPPSGGRHQFKVAKPGIVNGLQTVISLHTAYNKLSEYDMNFFDENCYVLVRLLSKNAVNRISEVVLATNNQNAMQQRNLVSNSTEQAHYATFFPERLEWFYEAKQGAWNAFKQNHKTWLPRIDKHPQGFRAKRGFKTIDNHSLAQDWLAFLGFANRAVNDRKSLFDQDKEYYKLIFRSRPRHHAYENYKSVKQSLENSINESPDPHLMLLAHLSRRLVHEIVPSAQANRKATLERHGVNEREDVSQAEESRILNDDHDYVLNQILGSRATQLVFVDFLGFIFFKVFGEDIHGLGATLLNDHSWRDLKSKNDIAIVKSRITTENFDKNDILLIMWLLFKEAVGDVQTHRWNSSYINARNKTQFILDHRHQIFQEVMKYDATFKRKTPLRVYTIGFRDGEGILIYLERIVNALKQNL